MDRVSDGAMNGVDIEKRVKDLFDEVRESEGGVILLIENLHDFIKDDRIARILRFALAQDGFKVRKRNVPCNILLSLSQRTLQFH